MKPALFTPVGSGASPGGTLWVPADLGIKLLLWWQADTVADGPVSSWASSTGGLVLAQATGSLQPVRSATSLDGFPGITFDGTDDFMEVASTSGLPSGTTSGEIWVVAKFVPPSGSTTVAAFGYGTNAASAGRRMTRGTLGAARVDDNTAIAQSASGAWDDGSGLPASTTGPNLLHGLFTAALHTGGFNGGTPFVSGAAAMNTVTTRTRMGAALSAGAGNFWPGPIRDVLTTLELTADEQLRLEGYLAHRSGIGAKLPADHPWKVRPPTV